MKKKNIYIGLILIALIAGAAAFYLYPLVSLYATGKEKTRIDQDMTYFISSGTTLDALADDLKEKGIIQKVAPFKKYALRRNLKDATVEPGKYELKAQMSIEELVTGFRKGYGEKEVRITFNNARTSDELAEKIADNLEIDKDELAATLKDPEVAKKYGFTTDAFNVMFIPDTYNVYWDITTDELLDRMFKEYNKFWTEERLQKAKNMGLSPIEVSILASIVTCETVKSDESPVIAGVYVNRLNRGMPLEADPTLVWILGDFTIKRVLNKDKELDSPYNTYKYAGLPPGPIYVPSATYIDAVLNYQKHNYIFFCAKEDFSGYSNFAETYKQHLVNARKYQRALNEQKVYR
ncbi:endolytic transglycosylase MltG [Flavobacteriaceae bacterium M23B6Z8]